MLRVALNQEPRFKTTMRVEVEKFLSWLCFFIHEEYDLLHCATIAARG